MLTIDFLYTDDCPHCPEALNILNEVLSEEHVEADINTILVTNKDVTEISSALLESSLLAANQIPARGKRIFCSGNCGLCR